MQIRDRIKELRRVPASTLRANPHNWRTHPKTQQDALRGLLAEVGYADALLARELPDGSLMLIDGHLRAETTPDMDVPVLVLDVTEAEADLLLATVDPLAGLAGDLVADIFVGSGTTLIAAEQLNRRCYAMEIAPNYVDVAVRRWQKVAGKDATLEADGKTFADTEKRPHGQTV